MRKHKGRIFTMKKRSVGKQSPPKTNRLNPLGTLGGALKYWKGQKRNIEMDDQRGGLIWSCN